MHKLLIPIALAACGGPTKPAVEPVAAVPDVALPAGCRGNAVLEEAGNGNLVVTGTWRDQPVRILVDTGANGGSISTALVEKHALPVVGKAKYGSAAGIFVDTTVHDAGPLEIGGATVSADRFFAQANHGESYDFAIGLDQLVAHAMVLDLPNGSFCLAASPHALATEPLRVAGNKQNRDIVVAARFGKVQLEDMILDTGAGVTTVNHDHLPKLAATELPERAQAIDGTGHAVDLALYTVPEVCVGAACATEHMIMPSDDLSGLVGHHVDGIVGLPFFADHVLVVDFPAQKIGIK